jgi:uncharacterized Fe-S center protein/quercetin dioxygenase-like cupin family protein
MSEQTLFPCGSKAAANFTGNAYVNMLIDDKFDLYDCTVYDVRFEAGCRNYWHKHDVGQLLICTSGRGFYQERGMPARELKPGDIVEIPAHVEHWHGAAPDCAFNHIGITPRKKANSAIWGSPVTDAEYKAATTKPASGLSLYYPVIPTEKKGAAKVYFTKDISPAGLDAVYKALGRTPHGKVAVKLSSGEPGGHYFLNPALIKTLVQSWKPTIVECNTAYGGGRDHTRAHYKVAADHGFTAIAPVQIMDEAGEIGLPVKNDKGIATHLKEDLVGAHFKDYDFYAVLSHFKGHMMGGFGGALKNLSIGCASRTGKVMIHTANTRDSGDIAHDDQNGFLESMAEAAKAVVDAGGRDNFLYISVINNLSVDCDCDNNPDAPTMADIGIAASLDPVALDKACLDLVYAAPISAQLKQRIESRNGAHTVYHAAALGLGSLEYELITI